MQLDEHLAQQEAAYSHEHKMLGVSYKGPGYHTRVPDGTWVHPIRNAIRYAVALLYSDDPAHHERAADVICKVLSLQDQDPTSRTYGIWPYLLEEPFEQMQAPDWNWADFCGADLAEILIRHGAKLPGELVAAAREGLGHSAWSIFRRNVGSNYTNIAVAGAAVTAAAGELLSEPRLLAYATRRLRNFIEFTEYHGGLNEYNSPGYTMVTLGWCDWVLNLVSHECVRSDAEMVRRMVWRFIADYFHPGTGQWAGPHSRNYSDLLAGGTARFLSEHTGVIVTPHPTQGQEPRGPNFIDANPCPEELVERFRQLPEEPLTVRSRFIRQEPDENSTRGTTWLTADACLGTVNRDTFWTQRRPLIGYWRTEQDPAVVLRLRFLHDGKDFASALLRNVQVGPRVLSAVNLVTNQGDWHCHLDRPADGLFQAEDFRLRYELCGQGVSVDELGDGRFALHAGYRTAIVHTAEGSFGPHKIAWEASTEDGKACVDAVCYRGPARSFDFTDFGTVALAAGLELLGGGEEACAARVCVNVDEGEPVRVTWAQDAEFSIQSSRLPEG